MEAAAVAQALSSLERWLETMRGPQGYSGPVAHWWQNCLQFTGAGLDWRYEGIVFGYLTLYRRTGSGPWLEKAHRAGQDLVQAQLSSGNYRNSSFELNPYAGGTPHEAAADLALLHLAETLRTDGDASWSVYLEAAERNIRAYQIGVLWDAQARSFRDDPHLPSFVPNKAATLAEALFRLAALTGDEAWIETYALPTLEAVLAHQVRGGSLDGAIHQSSRNGRRVDKFFPYYVARCLPGLVAGYEHSRDERFLDAAQRAITFVLRWRYEDGSFPQVVYRGGRVNRYPQWIAPVGDILRAMALLRRYGLDADPQPTHEWLLRGQEPSGAFRTAHGFASQISQRHPGSSPEFRDLLPVCGWNDKAFRYLAEQTAGSREQVAGNWQPATGTWQPATASSSRHHLASPSSHLSARGGGNRVLVPPSLGRGKPATAYETECTLRGQQARYHEDDTAIELRRGEEVLYLWTKGAEWAERCAPELLWK